MKKTEQQIKQQIERDDEIRLTPEKAVELAEWIFACDCGIFSADASDDKSKQALLILLSAMAYDEDAANRENIFIDVTRRIFSYTFAADAAENRFIAEGFGAWRRGAWQPEQSEVKN